MDPSTSARDAATTPPVPTWTGADGTPAALAEQKHISARRDFKTRMKPTGRGAIGRPRPISKLSDCLLPYRDRHDLISRTQSSRR
jgi:hypothetical protein